MRSLLASLHKKKRPLLGSVHIPDTNKSHGRFVRPPTRADFGCKAALRTRRIPIRLVLQLAFRSKSARVARARICEHYLGSWRIVVGLLVIALVMPPILFLLPGGTYAATETRNANSHITGDFATPDNALGATNDTWAGVPNTVSNYTSRWAMDDPSGVITGTQTIDIVARKGSNSAVPTLQVNLYESGALVQSVIATTEITNTTSQTISGTFDASAVSDPNNVQIEVIETGVGGSSSVRNSAQIDSITWTVNLAVVSAPTVTTASPATSITATSATIGGNITATGNQSPTVRGFATSTDATLSSSVSTSTESGTFGTGAWTADFSNSSLTGNTTYYFRAYATNSVGTGLGSIQSFLTLPATPSTPTFASVTVTTMTVNWSAPTGGAASYKIERCAGAGCSDWTELATGIGSATYDDSSLSANTLYRYRVRATNATGDGLYSAIGEQTTSEEPTPGTRLFRLQGGIRLLGGTRLR